MRNWKRRLLAGALALVVTAGLLPTAALAAEGTGGTIDANSGADDIASIFGSGASYSDTDGVKTITLTDHVTVNATVEFAGGEWTLALGEYTLSGKSGEKNTSQAGITPLKVSGGTLTISGADTAAIQGGDGGEPERLPGALGPGPGGHGGAGISVTGGSIEGDSLTVRGGKGAVSAGAGGAGVHITDGSIAVTSLTAAGGSGNTSMGSASGGSGGSGVSLGGNGTVSAGTLIASGGNGGTSSDAYNGGSGGSGVSLGGSASVSAGTLTATGGNGGNGGLGKSGGSGGSGVSLGESGSVTVTDTLTATGGNGGNSSNGTGGPGGSGIRGYDPKYVTATGNLAVNGGEGGTGSNAGKKGAGLADHSGAALYQVTFNADGGRPEPEEQWVSSGNKATEPSQAPTRTDYNFLGWFKDDNKWNFSSDTVQGDMTLTAKWAELYTVTVSATAGGTASGGGSFTANSSVTVIATANSGHHFVKWTENGQEVSTSASYTFTITGSRTLEAVFAPDSTQPDKYPVTVNYGTGDGSYAQGETVNIQATVPAGQRFSHWTVEQGGMALANPNSSTTSFIMPAGAVTVTAHFENIPTPPSGGSDDSEPTYRPDVEDSQGGTTTVSPRNPERGDKVTITPKPDDGCEVADVTVKDRRGRAVEVQENSDGTYTFTQPSGKVTIEVTYQPVETAWVNPFTDVAAGDWCYEAVEYVQKNGLMQGTGPATFSPDAATSRGMIVAILWRMAGSPAMEDEIWGYPFADVDANAYYGTAVYWARLNGIANGYGDEAFGPNDPISREQLAVMLYNYAGQPPVPNLALMFSDADQVSGYADSAMRWAVDMGIISGKGGNILDPKGQATRAQAAAMLMRFCER